jgi:hypothetical protein
VEATDVATPREKEQALDRAVRMYEDCQEHHAEFTKGVRRRSDAYHALKDIRKDASYGGWRNAHFTPYPDFLFLRVVHRSFHHSSYFIK